MSIKSFIGLSDTSIKSVSNTSVERIKTILGSGLNQIPFRADALFWLDGTIITVGESKYFQDKTANSRNFLITGYDFDSTWEIGMPYKTASTISAPAADAALIDADINNYLYASDGTPNQIPVISLFQDVDYEHKLFCKHIAQTVDVNGVEVSDAKVIDIVLYANIKTGADLTSCQSYYSVTVEDAMAKWVSSDGNDITGDGSKATPWATLSKAMTTLNDGNYIYVKTGLTLSTGQLVGSKINKVKGLGFVKTTPSDTTYGYDLRSGLTEFTGIYDIPSANATYNIYGNGSTNLKFNKNYINAGASILFGAFTEFNGNVIKGSATMGRWTLRPSGAMPSVSIENNYFNVVISNAIGTEAAIANHNVINAVSIVNNKLLVTLGLTVNMTAFTSLIYKGNYCKGGKSIILNYGTVDVSYNTNLNHILSIERSNDVNIASIKNNTNTDSFIHAECCCDIENNVIYNPTLNASGGYSGINKLTATAVTHWHFKRNLIYANQTQHYLLLVGADVSSNGDSQMSEIIIEQNKFKNIASGASTHSLMVGYQVDAVIKHNKLDIVSGYSIVIEGKEGLAYTSGGVFGNILNIKTLGIVDGGMDGLCVYNNTIVSTSNGDVLWGVAFYDHGGTPPHPSNCKFKNNIMILLGPGGKVAVETSQDNNEIDYNIYYCPSGTLQFKKGASYYNFAQWQGLGYDTHSMVLTEAQFNGLFTDFANGDYSLKAGSVAIGAGIALDASYDDGLDASTAWGADTELPVVVTKQQGASWDIGAYVH